MTVKDGKRSREEIERGPQMPDVAEHEFHFTPSFSNIIQLTKVYIFPSLPQLNYLSPWYFTKILTIQDAKELILNCHVNMFYRVYVE